MDGEKIDSTLFGLLLSAESGRDETRASEEQRSWLLRLAQTGLVVLQLKRLHGVLDAMSMQYSPEEPAGGKDWRAALEQERDVRVKLYCNLMEKLAVVGGDGNEESECDLLKEIEREEQQCMEGDDAVKLQ